MSRSTTPSGNPFAFAGPITLDSLDELFAHHRRLTGGWGMDTSGGSGSGSSGSDDGNNDGGADGGNNQPARPDGISEDEWNALGDPGRSAIVREREARQAAERALAASRARPKPPGDGDGKGGGSGSGDGKNGDEGKNKNGGEVDIEAIVQRAVAAAVKPFQERDEEREAEEAAERVRSAVLEAAKPRFHDATDALAQIDLRTVLDGNGQPDATKITEAIDNLVTRKPHLAKVVDERRHGQDGTGATPGGSTRPLNDRVSDKLSRMQERAGVKFAASE